MTDHLNPEHLPVLFYGRPDRSTDIYHLVRFETDVAVIALAVEDACVIVLPDGERDRAVAESRATKIYAVEELGIPELSRSDLSRATMTAMVIQEVLNLECLSVVATPPDFPVAVADELRRRGSSVVVLDDVDGRRRPKRADELERIAAAQRGADAAYAAAMVTLQRATVGSDGLLMLEGEILTSERLREIMQSVLARYECTTPLETIAAPGVQAAEPHAVGAGPLRANEAIVIDIYPQHRSRYWADMTRTVSRGTPPTAICEMYNVVRRIHDAAITMLRPGMTGVEIHERVEDMFFEAGYDTVRRGQQHVAVEPRGTFLHGTGHGVGLELHELPGISRGRAGALTLQAGDVVAIEPGLYASGIGGVRLEDLLLLTETGSVNLTAASREMIIS